MDQEKFIRSDLAEECRARALGKTAPITGVDFSEQSQNDIIISRLFVLDKEGERAIGKPCGGYVTLGFKNVLSMDEEEKSELTLALRSAFCSLVKSTLEQAPRKVLVIGIGNRHLTCDALGPLTAEGLTVTRSIALCDPELFKKLHHLETSCLLPGISEQTGIESSELIKSAVSMAKPDLVVLIDALAAASPDRLVRTVQLCNTGISPGSGVGNRKERLDRAALGVPVIAVGVPTVVDSSTLVFDALERSGMTQDNIPPSLLELLENGKRFFVSTGDCDASVKELSLIIADALNEAFSLPA